MSKWIEIPVSLLLVIVATFLAAGAPVALAQDDGSAQGEGTKAPAADIKRAMISSGLDSEAIATMWPEAAVWLEPPDEERVLALFEPEAESPAKGALVILADEGQSAASALAGALRRPLARAGWAVMTLGLESPPYAVEQFRRQQAAAAPDASEGASDRDTATEDSVMIDVMDSVDVDELEDQYRTRVRKSLVVAVEELTDRGYDRLAVVGVGRASAHVARMAATAGGDVSALIWIAPVFTTDDSGNLTDWLAEAGQVRVLELHSSYATETVDGDGVRSPREREAAFRRADITAYTRQPVAVSERPGPRDAPALANRLSAWLASDR